MEYKYITDNNLENRQSYQYTRFNGIEFLFAYEKSRNISNFLDTSLPALQTNDIVKDCEKQIKNCDPTDQDSVILHYELCYFIYNVSKKNQDHKIFNKFDMILKTFEVRKRLYPCYNYKFKPYDEYDYKDYSLYLLFACGLICAYSETRNLKYINALLKVNDSLLSLITVLNRKEQNVLCYSLSEELKAIKQLYFVQKIKVESNV